MYECLLKCILPFVDYPRITVETQCNKMYSNHSRCIHFYAIDARCFLCKFRKYNIENRDQVQPKMELLPARGIIDERVIYF